MRNTDVYIVSDNILSPLGVTTAANFSQLKKSVSGIRLHEDITMSPQPFYAALFGKGRWPGPAVEEIPEDDFPALVSGTYTKFERLLIGSIQSALLDSGIDAGDKKTVLILSSTKGNISLLETAVNAGLRSGPLSGLQPFQPGPALKKRIALYTSARLVAEHFGFANSPIVVSNACISGVMGILTGARLIRSGVYENAVVAGADVISNFVLSGFQSFQAISSRPCRPFDRSRDGITLGEGAGTVILSSRRQYAGGTRIMGGSTSNDANHLSAPSRTGAELGHSINKALGEAGLSSTEIDFISAHGTATVYNDEMEAKALTLAGLQTVPVNSLKGYYGHTLGAAGLIESIVANQSLKEGLVIPTIGFEEMGVSQPLNVCNKLFSTPLKNCLKTASGFGGCNAALVLSKS